MRVLGVDPGLAHLGWGVVEVPPGGGELRSLGYGVLRTPSSWGLQARVRQLTRELLGVVQRLAPDKLVAEAWVPYPGWEVSDDAIEVLRVCGALVAFAELRGLPYEEYPARALKGLVTGDRCASKQGVQQAVQRLLGLPAPVSPDHAADALAAALAGHYGTVPEAPLRRAPRRRRASGTHAR